MANHIRVITAIIFSQLVVLYFGFRMDVSLTELLTTVAVASLVEIIYHVKLVRKIDQYFHHFGKTVTNF
ncbi:MAG: hypothetical protein ACLR0I_04610 [Streptococcus salivarius]